MEIGLTRADARQEAVAAAFAAKGHDVRWVSVQDAVLPSVVVLPMPVSKDGVTLFGSGELLCDWWRRLGDKRVFGGRVSQEVAQSAAAQGITIGDHFDRQEEVILNIVPTVEGALEIALRETPFTIHHSPVLVCGYGRIGKLLSHHLQALGAHVWVTARKAADQAWCEVHGYDYYPTQALADAVRGKRIIFNTVPAPLFTAAVLDNMERDALLIDLAGGAVDGAHAAATRKRTMQALGLPALAAPHTAGEIICNTILGLLDC